MRQQPVFAEQFAVVGGHDEDRPSDVERADVVDESTDHVVCVGDLGVVQREDRLPLVVGQVTAVRDHLVEVVVKVDRELRRLVGRHRYLVGKLLQVAVRRIVRPVGLVVVDVQKKGSGSVLKSESHRLAVSFIRYGEACFAVSSASPAECDRMLAKYLSSVTGWS